MAPVATIAQPSVEDLAAAIAEVPALSATVRAVMDACDVADTSGQDVARLVLSDQGLTANVLKLANSAAYGNRRRVTTATDAVVTMGLSAVKSLAISSHTSMLLNRSLPGYAMARGDLWQHSLAVAFVCRRFCNEGDPWAAEEAFVAGLLHDVGKLVLSDILRGAFDDLVRTAQTDRITLCEGERELLGFDHAELGARIATSWGFPERLVEAIGLHHRPGEAAVAPLLAHRVAAADEVCKAIAAGVDAGDMHHLVDPDALDAVGLDEHGLTALVADVAPLVTIDPLAE